MGPRTRLWREPVPRATDARAPSPPGFASDGRGSVDDDCAGSTPRPPASALARLSVTTSSGSPRPPRRMSWKNVRQLSVSSLVPGLSARSTFLPSWSMPHAQSTASRARPGRSRSATSSTKRYRSWCSDRSRVANASYSSQSRSVTSLTAVRDRSERPCSSANVDSMSRVDSGVHLDGEALQLLGAPSESLAYSGPVRLPQVRHLRHCVLDRAVVALQPPPPVAVPIPRTLPVAAPVVRPPEPVLHLSFKHFLHELPHAASDQVGAGVVVSAPRQQVLDPLGRLPRCWNPSASHGST